MKVIWYIPNVIDYFRIVFLLISLYYFEKHMINTLIFYSLSIHYPNQIHIHIDIDTILGCSMDMIDGLSARLLNQSSLLGGVLDMVIDRMSVIAFIIYLSKLYPEYVFVLSLILYLDIISHWMQMVATFLKGNQNHKQ